MAERSYPIKKAQQRLCFMRQLKKYNLPQELLVVFYTAIIQCVFVHLSVTHSLQDMRQQAAVAAKVFIQRDYTNGTMCQFQTKFPSELETKIDKQQFEETIRTLNNLYAEAEKLGSQSFIEGCLACLTAYAVFLCMETHYEKVLKRIAKYIQEQNDKIYAPRGLLLTDPIERGLRVIEITIYEDRSFTR